MNFTDIFIRRPVLATVVSLLILVLGLRALGALPVLQYPRTENAVVTVTTTYYGADPDVVAGFITTPLENAIAQANGIDYMTLDQHDRRQHDHRLPAPELRRRQGADRDQHQGQLGAQPACRRDAAAGADGAESARPSTRCISASTATCWRRTRSPTTWCAWCSRSCRRCQACRPPSCSAANTSRCAPGSIRTKLAAYGLTATDVSQALAANNYISGLGTTKGQMVQVDLTASTDLHSLDEFRNLVVKQADGAIVRLKDVANVTLGADDYESEVAFDGKQRGLYRHPGRAGRQPARRHQRRARRSSPASSRSCRRA